MLLIAAPALGKNDNKNPSSNNANSSTINNRSENQGKGQEKQELKQVGRQLEVENDREDDEDEATSSAGKKDKENEKPTECDPNANWKNHGEYVSCVAKLHPGGATTSAAARSDIGKKHNESTLSATPSGEKEEIEEGSKSGNLATEAIQTVAHGVGSLIQTLRNLLFSLTHLF